MQKKRKNDCNNDTLLPEAIFSINIGSNRGTLATSCESDYVTCTNNNDSNKIPPTRAKSIIQLQITILILQRVNTIMVF